VDKAAVVITVNAGEAVVSMRSVLATASSRAARTPLATRTCR